MQWTDIIGHNNNIKMLRHMEDSRRMPHAVLLTGPSGIGKFMVASVLGAALLCSALKQRPCGICQSCRQIAYGAHPDFLVINPDGANIKIEQIRKLQQAASLAPYLSQRRVCIIDGAELMTTQAANSLLKVLEEPTGDVVFILVSANKEMLLSTIISRCMAIAFQPLTDVILAKALVDKGFSPEESKVAARLSGGRMGNAVSMLAPDGFAMRNQAVIIIEGLLVGGINVVWDSAIVLEKMERKNILQILGYFTYILRDFIMIITGQDQQLLFNIDLVEKLREQANQWSEGRLLKALGVVEGARRAINANANTRLTSEALLIKIYDLAREV